MCSTTDVINDIPLIIKGDKVGVIEEIKILPNKTTPWVKISINGTLIKELKDPENLIKLLQVEGIHLGTYK